MPINLFFAKKNSSNYILTHILSCIIYFMGEIRNCEKGLRDLLGIEFQTCNLLNYRGTKKLSNLVGKVIRIAYKSHGFNCLLGTLFFFS